MRRVIWGEAECWDGWWLGIGVNGHFYWFDVVLELTFINLHVQSVAEDRQSAFEDQIDSLTTHYY